MQNFPVKQPNGFDIKPEIMGIDTKNCDLGLVFNSLPHESSPFLSSSLESSSLSDDDDIDLMNNDADSDDEDSSDEERWSDSSIDDDNDLSDDVIENLIVRLIEHELIKQDYGTSQSRNVYRDKDWDFWKTSWRLLVTISANKKLRDKGKQID